MLSITCTFCRAPINLNDGELALIMQEVEEKKPKSYLITCWTCRKGNKVPMKRIEQAYVLAGSPPVPETPAEESEKTPEETKE
ncbi:MAG: hypothetical protein U9R25_04900 [Chloroflexota bacterium]|nr:hypothetical protein [Chloroflexota bacterium]